MMHVEILCLVPPVDVGQEKDPVQVSELQFLYITVCPAAGGYKRFNPLYQQLMVTLLIVLNG